MGKKSRETKLTNEWLNNYAKESTGIILDLLGWIGEPGVPPKLAKRIQRLKAASALWDEIQRKRDVFVP